jgi:hypothetical protein
VWFLFRKKDLATIRPSALKYPHGSRRRCLQHELSRKVFLLNELLLRSTPMTSVYIAFQSIRSFGQTFAKRIGSPDECTSALGHVSVGFSWLEQSLEEHIAELAGLSPSVAPALTAELSFKTKVSVLSSLVRLRLPLRKFNADPEDPAAVWEDMVRMLFECENLRNKLLHSHWLPRDAPVMRRTKTTAKAAQGIRVSSEDLSADYLLNVYDYILNVDYVLREFFL